MLLPFLWLLFYAIQLFDTDASGALFASATGEALLNGLVLSVAVAVFSVALALPLAWLTHATDMPGRKFFRVALNLPLAVPSYVSGFVVVAALGPTGWLQQALEPFGVERLPEIYGFNGAFVALLFSFPYALIPLQAALNRVDPRIWEASRSLGLKPGQAFWRVIFPNVRGAIAAGFLLVGLYAMSDFGAVSLMHFDSLSYVIYVRYQSLFDKDEAIFLALVLAVVALAFLAAYRWIRGAGGSTHVQASAREWPTIKLGTYRWPAVVFCSLVTLLGVGLPIFTVGLWLFRGLALGNTVGDLGAETWTTLSVGIMAAFVTVFVALIPALLTRFGSARVSKTVHVASHVGYALPGIVVALSLVFFAIRYAGPFYQTTALLIFAYVVRFLPLALGVLDDALESQNSRLYDACRGMGRSPVKAWATVVIPCAASGIAAGWLIVFMSVVKELPATLLLSPLNFSTLATRIWMLTEEAFFTAAAPPVLVLILFASVALAFGTRSESA